MSPDGVRVISDLIAGPATVVYAGAVAGKRVFMFWLTCGLNVAAPHIYLVDTNDVLRGNIPGEQGPSVGLYNLYGAPIGPVGTGFGIRNIDASSVVVRGTVVLGYG